MNCCYAIFCESTKIDPALNQITTEKIFSILSLEEPGTTPFTYMVGITGVKVGSKGSIEISIQTPSKAYSAAWVSPVSQDELTVHNALFNCSQIPFDKEGVYTFVVKIEETKEIISSRSMRVSFKQRIGV